MDEPPGIVLPPPIDAPPQIFLPPPIVIKSTEPIVVKYKPRAYGKRADYKKELEAYITLEKSLLLEMETSENKDLIGKKLLAAAKALTSIRLPKPEDDKYTEWSLQQRYRLETGYDWHCSKKIIELFGDQRTSLQYDRDVERLSHLDDQDEKFEEQHAKTKR